jgi:hypothetical protein
MRFKQAILKRCEPVFDTCEVDVNAVVNDHGDTFLHIAAEQWWPDYFRLRGTADCIRYLIEKGASVVSLNIEFDCCIVTAINNANYTLMHEIIDTVRHMSASNIVDLFERLYYSEWYSTVNIAIYPLLYRFYDETVEALFDFLSICESYDLSDGVAIEFLEDAVLSYCTATSACFDFDCDKPNGSVQLYKTLFLDRVPGKLDFESRSKLAEDIDKDDIDGWIFRRIEKQRKEYAEMVLDYKEIRRDVLRLSLGLFMLRLPLLQLVVILDQMHPFYKLVDFGLKWRMLYAVRHFVHE